MNRRSFLGTLGAAALEQIAHGQPGACSNEPADFTLRIGQVNVELAPGRVFKTTGYNGSAPGPVLRMPLGREVTVEVRNETSNPELVHFHGLHIPSDVDGSAEEGTPPVPAHGCRRFRFAPQPAGTRWYHTHMPAKRNLDRATYTGQFGFLYIEPKDDPGAYDQEVFLALKEWDPYFSLQGDEGIEVAYKRFSINGRSLGHGDPIRVKEGQRVMFRILNASATIYRKIAFSGHEFQVVALDGNPVPTPQKLAVLAFGPAERIDSIVEMNRPGNWVLGATNDHDRINGMGIVVEYAGRSGEALWMPPPEARDWSYVPFGQTPSSVEPAEPVPLVIQKKFAGSRWVDNWTINGKAFPKTDPIRVKANRRYRLIFDNRSDEAHPLHLHRHTFELTRVEGEPTAGILKDVVVVAPKKQVEVDFVANNPGPTLFHCHQQLHMDYGFMTMLEYE
jgi:FtsP/CotA-like multicopper oxidase with cupredoxin domain